MSQGKLAAIILAAGQGKRMKSDLPKVLHEVGGKPMIVHVINQAKSCGATPIVVIVGHKREMVIDVVEGQGQQWAVQEQQLGTGHAVQSAEEKFRGYKGDVIVLSGDVPLLRSETISSLLAYHREQEAVATVLTADAPDPTGYGRIIRGEDGALVAIREHKDCTDEEREIVEMNSGIYLFKAEELFEALSQLDNNNAQGEFYLTDVFGRYWKEKKKVAAFKGDFDEILGVNSVDDLARAESNYKARLSLS